MPINFSTLIQSEKEIREMFVKFFGHVVHSQEYLLKNFKTKKVITGCMAAHIKSCEKKANAKEAEILDEANWIISKDMPRASHLRFLIAIIRSIKDLERMGDFNYKIAEILYYQKDMSKEVHDILCKVMTESLKVAKEVYRNIASGPHQNRNYYENRLTPMILKFSSKYRALFKELGQILFRSRKDLGQKINIFTAIKYAERNADHAYNIIENFLYINDNKFYLTKESRKIK